MSKADALAELRSSQFESFVIDDFVSFSHADWNSTRSATLQQIHEARLGPVVAVRSSAAVESFEQSSVPGEFLTVLGVPVNDTARLVRAIERVFRSMSASPTTPGVLVQTQLTAVRAAGVATTIDTNGSPYTTVEYDDLTGQTNAVTAGQAVKRLLLADLRSSGLGSWQKLASAILDTQTVFQCEDLVIEFAIDSHDRIHIFQAWTPGRTPVLTTEELTATVARVNGELQALRASRGRSWVFSDMTDWNPAEILGSVPAPLDVSLYAKLITDGVWADGRADLGYFRCEGALLVEVGSHPYVDVRRSFLSLTPNGLKQEVRERIVDEAVDRLLADLSLHDKAEYDLLTTYWPPKEQLEVFERKTVNLRGADRASLLAALKETTRRGIERWDETLRSARAAGNRLLAWRQRNALDSMSSPEYELVRVEDGLSQCASLGTRPFAAVARLAFIANGLVRDLCGPETEAEFWSNVRSPVDKLVADLANPSTTIADLVARYGHLRPHTYNVASPRYGDRPDFLASLRISPGERCPRSPSAIPELASSLSRYLEDLGVGGAVPSGDALIRMLARAVTAREYHKFTFSAVLSDTLERLAWLGARLGCSRDDIRLLRIDQLLQEISVDDPSLATTVERERCARRHLQCLCYPDVLTSKTDLAVVEYVEASPTFVSDAVVDGMLWRLESMPNSPTEVDGKIIAIESADPGYDWIFSRPILGLVTSYGGSSSHMTIRCHELGLPAAIGCGSVRFALLTHGSTVLLDCRHGALISIGSRP